ncbi:transposon Ty3-G Gag-Pol polyprotein [Trichonephila clavipes]|nr:transposon Ty3-G Gag-Pol polyprotein [Trichonephila clavipes]
MRSALKDDINATCAQLVYGTTLRLPSDLVTSDSINQTANSTYVTSLIQTMRSLNPVSTAQHGTQNIYINLSLKTCSHIFLRSDKVNPPLTPPYTGPHLVISRNDKNFIIDLNGKQSTVSIDRIKPAYLLADVTDHSDLVQTQTIIEKPVTAAPHPSIPYTTRYGRKVAAVAEWYRYRTVACFVTGSSPVPQKTRRVGQRCTLNLSRAETSSRWCGVEVREGGCQLSDEAHFWLNGYVNKQNCRIWSEANPQVYVETPLHPEKLTVWCALWAGGIIGPYFFKNDEGHNVTVNCDHYRAMITNFFIPELNNHDVQEL